MAGRVVHLIHLIHLVHSGHTAMYAVVIARADECGCPDGINAENETDGY